MSSLSIPVRIVLVVVGLAVVATIHRLFPDLDRWERKLILFGVALLVAAVVVPVLRARRKNGENGEQG